MSTGLLDFFVLEGSEYLEQMDALLARAAPRAPDADAFARFTRALRGSATMAKLTGISDVAGPLERIAQALRDGALEWSPQLAAESTAAIDDLRILVRGVRRWGVAEQARSDARARELERIAPAPRRERSRTPAAASSAFLALQTAEVAAGLERFSRSGGEPAAFADTLGRIRTLHGVAALLDLPPLADVVAAVDDAGTEFESGTADATDALRALFRAAATVLHEGSEAIRAGGRPRPDSRAADAFTAAASSFAAGADATRRIVPIESLFADDGGAHVVHAAPHPPTTPSRRFGLEVVSQAEHLRRLVGDARRSGDAPTRGRLAHELGRAVRALARTAESFGEAEVAASLNENQAGADALDPTALAALDRTAARLAARADESLPAAPSGAALRDMLGAGIAGLESLVEAPMAEPIAIGEDEELVPITLLVYSGKAALRRAAQLGSMFRQAGSTPHEDELAELYDLLELAGAE